MSVRTRLLLSAAFSLALSPALAVAGGLDLPIVYTARHAGMGGTAIGGVGDASAVLHNPAGLSGVHGLQVLGNVTFALTNLQTSPGFANQNVETGNTIAPVPFLAAAYRISHSFSAGLGIYPVGAVSGTFKYPNPDTGLPEINSQNTLAFEISPAVSYKPIEELSFGVGYRITVLKFDRHKGVASNPVTVDINSLGANFTGFRFGAQWRPLREIAIGAVYRPKITLRSSADSGHILGFQATDIKAEMVYPAKFGAGVRLDLLEDWSFAVDYEFVQNSSFDKIALQGKIPSGTLPTEFVFNWSDSSTFKVGVEYRPLDPVALRIGYAFDGKFSNIGYPDTYMQPPAVGHYFTLGAGYRGESWSANVAFAYRPDETVVIAANDIASVSECRFCTYPGTYSSRLDMALVDFSKDFDL